MQASLMCNEKYSLSTDLYHHRSEIQLHIDSALPSSVKTKSPVKKIIRLANNILKLNFLQCALLCLLIKKNSTEQQLKHLQLADLHKVSVLNEPFDRQLLIFLLLNGYHVKNYFVTNGAQVDTDPIILEHVPGFKQIYSDWKPEKSVKTISIVQINRFFEAWNQKKNSTIVKDKIDYNKIVDKILILSKTYNVGGCDDTGSVRQQQTSRRAKARKDEGYKKRKSNQNSQLNIRFCQQKDLVSDNPAQNSPMKNSASNKIPWFEDNNDLINLGRSQRTINRSFYNLRSDDVNPNIFQSICSHGSGMLDSLRNTNNGRFFNLNNSFVNLNNQSMAGGFNMFKSSLESDFLQVNETAMKKSKKDKGSNGTVKLKPTVSFDEL